MIPAHGRHGKKLINTGTQTVRIADQKKLLADMWGISVMLEVSFLWRSMTEV